MKRKLIIGTKSQKLALLILLLTACLVGSVYAAGSLENLDEEAARRNREEKERLIREALESGIKYEETPGIEDEEAARRYREEKERLEQEALENNIRYEETPGAEDEEAARKDREEEERLEQETLN